MTKLTLSPERTNYTFTFPGEVVSRETRGGLPRNRRDMIEATLFVDVTWSLDGDDYETLTAFYQARLDDDLAFTLDLVTDDPTMIEHTAHFVPGTFSFVAVEHDTYTVSCRLEVVLIARDEAFDEALVELFGEYGDGLPAFIDRLELFANFDLLVLS